MKDPCSLEIGQAADYPDFGKWGAARCVFTLAWWAGAGRHMRVTEVRHFFPKTLPSAAQSANKFKHLRGFSD
jgi:hypothetical protein